jgi:hypothetical protein
LKRITALCEDTQSAQRVVASLLELGIAERDVSVILVDRGEVHEADVEHKTRVSQGAAVGGATGAVVGLGLVAIGGVPGLFAAGPVLAALQGLGGGAAAGFLAGTLAGLAWWRSEVDVPAELANASGVVVGVPISAERIEKAEETLKAAGAKRIYVH